MAHTARPRLGAPLLLPGAAEPVGGGELLLEQPEQLPAVRREVLEVGDLVVAREAEEGTVTVLLGRLLEDGDGIGVVDRQVGGVRRLRVGLMVPVAAQGWGALGCGIMSIVTRRRACGMIGRG